MEQQAGCWTGAGRECGGRWGSAAEAHSAAQHSTAQHSSLRHQQAERSQPPSPYSNTPHPCTCLTSPFLLLPHSHAFLPPLPALALAVRVHCDAAPPCPAALFHKAAAALDTALLPTRISPSRCRDRLSHPRIAVIAGHTPHPLLCKFSVSPRLRRSPLSSSFAMSAAAIVRPWLLLVAMPLLLLLLRCAVGQSHAAQLQPPVPWPLTPDAGTALPTSLHHRTPAHASPLLTAAVARSCRPPCVLAVFRVSVQPKSPASFFHGVGDALSFAVDGVQVANLTLLAGHSYAFQAQQSPPRRHLHACSPRSGPSSFLPSPPVVVCCAQCRGADRLPSASPSLFAVSC